jgi:spore germination protein KC
MKRHILAPLTAALVLLTLTGCQDYTEYENMAHISAIGIDYNKETKEITVTVQELPSVKGESGGSMLAQPVNKTGSVHSATCSNIYDALSKIQQVVANVPFYGYTNTVVIGEEAARYKLYDIVKLFDRTPSIRSSTHLVIAKNAAETIATQDETHIMSSGEEIRALIENSRFTGAAYPVTLQEFEEMLAIGGLEGALPHILTVSNEDVKVKGGTGDGIRSDEERIGDEIVCGTAVFKGDSLVGYLDARESRGYGWLTDKKIKNFKTSADADDSDMLDFFRITQSKTKVAVRFDGGMPVIAVKVRVTSDIRKLARNDGGDIILAGQVEAIEQKLAGSVRADMEAALEKCQKEYRSDVFGFGFAVFRKDHRLWDETLAQRWDEIYPELKVELDVDAQIVNTGTNIRRFVVQ